MTDDKRKEPSFYDLDYAARELGISRASAYSAAAKGDIPTIRVGRLLRVPSRWFKEARGERRE